MNIKEKCVVTLHYKLTGESGELLDQSGDDPEIRGKHPGCEGSHRGRAGRRAVPTRRQRTIESSKERGSLLTGAALFFCFERNPINKTFNPVFSDS